MTRLVQIGNSKGIRIPKLLIEQAHLDEGELELKVVEGGLLISPRRRPREGWAEQVEQALQARGEEAVDGEWLDAELTGFRRCSLSEQSF